MNYPQKFIVALLLIVVPTGIAVFGASSLQSEQPKVSVAAGSDQNCPTITCRCWCPMKFAISC